MDKPTDDKRWTVLGSEYLIRRPWLTARRDRIRQPNGTVMDEYYVLEYPDWVNVIALTTEGKMLLERQYRHGLGRTCYEIPAGVVDPTDASPEAAARRELLEETGYEGGTWRELCTLSPNSSAVNNLCHTFIAEGVTYSGARHLEATEDIDVYFFSPAEVRGFLERGEVMQALMAAPLWRYFYEQSHPSCR